MRIYPTKEQLTKLYIEKGFSTGNIITLFNMGFKKLKELFKQYGIKTRKAGSNWRSGICPTCKTKHNSGDAFCSFRCRMEYERR